MRYLLVFKTLGELQEDPELAVKLSDGDTRSIDDIMIEVYKTPDWRSLKSRLDMIVEGPTYEIAMQSESDGGTDWWLKPRIKAYFELIGETEMLVWDQYYCAALTGLLASDSRMGSVETCEDAARKSADRGIAARRKMTGDSI
jgi:hypothetical protein